MIISLFWFRKGRLIFSCNKIPETEDLTDAFFRRILIINFTQQFFGEKDDPDLLDKLTTEEEFSGLLYELLSRLPRVLKHGIRKITSESMAETYDKYTRGSNPVKYFYEKALRPDIGNKIPKLEMYEYYEKFCRDHGLAPESDQSFSRKLTDDHHLKYDRFRLKGERVYCWIDVGLVDWASKKMEEQSNLEEIIC
ncbi:MAG: primase-like DNA-binding domain-containing protein [Nitrososphaeraceae archaeon]|jgi:putative DNA primase/helicase